MLEPSQDSPQHCLLQLQLPHQGTLRHNAPHGLPPDRTHSRPSYLAKVALGTPLPRNCPQLTPNPAPAGQATSHKQSTQGMLTHQATPSRPGEVAVLPNSYKQKPKVKQNERGIWFKQTNKQTNKKQIKPQGKKT